MTISKHFFIEIFQFFSLFVVLSISAILFRNETENLYRFLIIVADALIYFFWGMWHHSHKDRLDFYILIEYGMVSLLIILLAALGLGVVRFF